MDGKELVSIRPFEVLVGDPFYFRWVAVPDSSTPSGSVIHRPFYGVEAGLELCNTGRAVFISQVPVDSGRLPGKLPSTGYWAHGCTEGREVGREAHTVRVLAWVD